MMADNTRYMSQRSRRTLGEISRHLLYAAKGIQRLSSEGFWLLDASCLEGGSKTRLSKHLSMLIELQWLIDRHLQLYCQEGGPR